MSANQLYLVKDGILSKWNQEADNYNQYWYQKDTFGVSGQIKVIRHSTWDQISTLFVFVILFQLGSYFCNFTIISYEI